MSKESESSPKDKPRCTFDGEEATVKVDGVWVCAEHSLCAGCKMPLAELTSPPVECVCADYDPGSSHEEAMWCGIDCMEAAHGPCDYDPDEGMDDEEGQSDRSKAI